MRIPISIIGKEILVVSTLVLLPLAQVTGQTNDEVVQNMISVALETGTLTRRRCGPSIETVGILNWERWPYTGPKSLFGLHRRLYPAIADHGAQY